MTKRLESKYKIDRRMGENLWGRPKSPVNRREYGPGQHGQRRKGKLSDYGVQLKAKQKLRGYYANISEKQFRGIYAEAIRMKGDSGAHMIGLLERRLDAVVFRAKFVPTMFAARQFINHGHVKVNGKRVNIASYRLKVGDVVKKVNEQPIERPEQAYAVFASLKTASNLDVSYERDGKPMRLSLPIVDKGTPPAPSAAPAAAPTPPPVEAPASSDKSDKKKPADKKSK